MEKPPKDPYKGHKAKEVWDSSLSGAVGGFGVEENNALWESTEKVLELDEIGKELANETIIELAPGDSEKSAQFRDYCVHHGAARYIGVDLFSIPSNYPEKIENTEIEYVTGENGDALTFLLEQPDESAIIAQSFLLRDELIKGCKKLGLDPKQVMEALVREIHRVQKRGKPFISVGNGSIFEEIVERTGLFQEKSPLTFIKN